MDERNGSLPIPLEIKKLVEAAIASGHDLNEIATALFDAVPELVDRRAAHAHVERVYDAFHEGRTEMEGLTEPFVRVA